MSLHYSILSKIKLEKIIVFQVAQPADEPAPAEASDEPMEH